MPELLREALQKLVAGVGLGREESRQVMEAIYSGPGPAGDAAVHGMLTAALLTALASKGETVEEIVGFAQAMRAAAVSIGDNGGTSLRADLCGTGGHARTLFNISTAASLTAAAVGLTVAKHGNRTSTSVCGSADLLEAAGVSLDLPAERLEECLRSVGFAFLYAPLLHPGMRAVMPARRSLKIRTIFNLLGPLTNPAKVQVQVIGVPDAPLLPKLAEALRILGTQYSFVVYSPDGMGELSTTAVNQVAEIRGQEIRYFELDARDLGLPRADASEFACATKEIALARFRQVLAGEEGRLSEMVCLNAAAALLAGGLAVDWEEGMKLASAALRQGGAAKKLAALVQFTARSDTAAAHP